MPSRKLLLERKSRSMELTEAIRNICSMLEKKIRNLEKRKGKLETYKSELSEGVPLNEDQRIAAMKCDEVGQTLTFTKELLKQLTQTADDVETIIKRQAQIRDSELLERDTAKARDILIVQDVLSGLGDDAMREDFLAGKNGALKLTEEKLESLDKLYKLITPSHDVEYGEPSFEDQLTTASSHLAELVNSQVKDVLGTTYKELRDLILEIYNNEYFKSNFMRDPQEESGPPDSYAVSESCGKIAAPSITETTGYEIESHMVAPSTIEPSPPQPPAASTPTISTTNNSCSSGSSTSANLRPACPSQRQTENRTVFSTFSQSAKPYEELLGDPKNSFNFLLDSQIELDVSHIDPAVVAVHSKLPPSALLNYNPGAQHPDVVHFLQRSIDDPIAKMTGAASTNPPSVSAGQAAADQFLQPSQIAQRAPAANFSQSIPPQPFINQTYVNLQTFTAALCAGQFQQQQQQQSPPAQQQQQPLPQHQSLRQQQQQQQKSTTAIQEPKKHLMNVNATTFESLSFKQPPLQPQPQPAQVASASITAQVVHEDPPRNIPIAETPSTKARTANSPQFSEIAAQDKQPENESERYKESNNYGNYGSGSRTNYNNHNHSSSNTNSNSSIGRGMTREGLARPARGSASNGYKGRGGRSPNNNYTNGGRNAVSYHGNYSRDYHHHSNSYSRDNYEGASNGSYNNNNNNNGHYRRREGGGGGSGGGNTSGSGSASLRGNHRGGISSRGGNSNAGSNGGGNNRGNFRTVFNKSADPSP